MRAILSMLSILSELLATAAWAITLPELPSANVDVAMPTVTGNTYTVSSCGTLQSTINTAASATTSLTHVVNIDSAVGTCTGPILLPSRSGATGWVIIQSSSVASLPVGTRVVTSDSSNMPTIKYGESGENKGAIVASTGAQRYRLIGLNLKENTSYNPNWALVDMGYSLAGSTSTGYLILDRCLIWNTTSTQDLRRSIYGDADMGNTALIESYVAGARSSEGDTQGWLSISNPGPILIRNSYIEGAAENIMLCGATPASSGLMPHDITIIRNTFEKVTINTLYITKTLLELKCGVRVLVEGNIFMNQDSNQGDTAFRLTPRNDDYADATGTFLEVSDLTIQHNLIHDVVKWINAIGSDDGNVNGDSRLQTRHSKRWYLYNNLAYNIEQWITIQIGGTTLCTDYVYTCKIEDFSIRHNTIDGTTTVIMTAATGAHVNMDFRDNLIGDRGSYGIYGDADPGDPTPGTRHWGTLYFDGQYTWSGGWGSSTYTFDYNRVGGLGGDGVDSSYYPALHNSYHAGYTSIMWTNIASGDYTLQSGSPAKNASSDGTDQGVNFTLFNAAQTGGFSTGGSMDVKHFHQPNGIALKVSGR